MADESPARITRVVLKNYKSIVSCDVELRPITILVGPNGSGKSNFLDALRFVSEALTVGLEQAIRNRGNIFHILSEASWPGTATFEIDVEFVVPNGRSGHYGFAIGAMDAEGEFTVRRESLDLDDGLRSPGSRLFSVEDDGLMSARWLPNGDDPVGHARQAKSEMVRAWTPDRLALPIYFGAPEARLVLDLLTTMAFYSLSPEPMREIRPHETGQRLLSNGVNVASILRLSERANPEVIERITAYLSRILPGLREVQAASLGGYDLVSLRQVMANDPGWWDARPDQISDGTLRALGVLVALFQHRLGGKSATSLVGIEEPEAGLHPAAADVLFNALVDASATTQVLVTTHSADLLQSSDLDVESLLAVEAENGITKIGPVDAVGRSVLKDRLFTAGELLQMKQLHPEPAANGMDGASASPEPASAG